MIACHSPSQLIAQHIFHAIQYKQLLLLYALCTFWLSIALLFFNLRVIVAVWFRSLFIWFSVWLKTRKRRWNIKCLLFLFCSPRLSSVAEERHIGRWAKFKLQNTEFFSFSFLILLALVNEWLLTALIRRNGRRSLFIESDKTNIKLSVDPSNRRADNQASIHTLFASPEPNVFVCVFCLWGHHSSFFLHTFCIYRLDSYKSNAAFLPIPSLLCYLAGLVYK